MPITKPETTSQSSIAAELIEIKSQIATINSTMAKLIPVPAYNSIHRHLTPDRAPDTSPNSTISARVCTSYCAARHSTEDSFSLLLTNIDRCVTEKEIASLVSESLGAPEPECVNVTKLVPNWKNCEDLDYISFKVILHDRWKTLAMSSSAWPKNVKIREFIHRNKDTWKPTSLRNVTV